MRIIIVKGDGVIAPFVISSYIKELKKKSHEILIYDLSRDTLSENKIREIVSFKADFAFGYGLRGIIRLGEEYFFFRNIGVPVVCLHYDSPFLQIDSSVEKEMKNFPEMYINFVWDRYFLDIMKMYGYSNLYPIMLATDIDIFKPKENIISENSICFVGSFKLEKIKQFDTNMALLNEFINMVIELKLENIGVPVLDICMKMFEISKFATIKSIFLNESEKFWKIVYFALHAKGSLVVRDYYMRCIEGVPLHIYGNNDLKKENIILHPYVDYMTELASIYQKYALNINISSFQLETSVNNRVFDCFASKGFILSDLRYDMEKIFPDHWKEITFNNIQEMGKKGEYFLSHEKEKNELTRELYEIIIKKHTYKNRTDEILLVLEQYKREG